MFQALVPTAHRRLQAGMEFGDGTRVLLLGQGLETAEPATILRLVGFCSECGSKAYLIETEAKQRIVVCHSSIRLPN